jgi:hypothetical protein
MSQSPVEKIYSFILLLFFLCSQCLVTTTKLRHALVMDKVEQIAAGPRQHSQLLFRASLEPMTIFVFFWCTAFAGHSPSKQGRGGAGSRILLGFSFSVSWFQRLGDVSCFTSKWCSVPLHLCLAVTLRPIGLWAIEASTLSTLSVRRWRWGYQPHTPPAPYFNEDTWYSFLLGAEPTPLVIGRQERLDRWKNKWFHQGWNRRPSVL